MSSQLYDEAKKLNGDELFLIVNVLSEKNTPVKEAVVTSGSRNCGAVRQGLDKVVGMEVSLHYSEISYTSISDVAAMGCNRTENNELTHLAG